MIYTQLTKIYSEASVLIWAAQSNNYRMVMLLILGLYVDYNSLWLSNQGGPHRSSISAN